MHRSLYRWLAGVPRRRPDARLGNLPDVVSTLVDVALSARPSRTLRLAEVRTAAKHGEHRLQMGVHEDALFTEYGVANGPRR